MKTAGSVLVLYRPALHHRPKLERLLATARAYGRRTVIVSTEDPGLPEGAFDELELCPALDDVAAARAKVRALCAGRRVDAIFTFFERYVYTAALCRADNGVPGLRPEQAIHFRNKNVMQARAAELGVPTPAWCLPHTLGAVERFAEQVGYPIVIKPIDGVFSASTWKVSSRGELAELWPRFRDERHNFRVEQFVRGSVVHVDALYRDNEVLFERLGEYTESPMNFTNWEWAGSVSRSHELDDRHREILRLNAALVRGYGIGTGVTHGEFFVDDGGAIFLGEVAARPGGFVDLAIEADCGVNLNEEWVKLELDPSHRPAPRPGGESGVAIIYSKERGVIRDIGPTQELLAQEGVVSVEMWKRPGDVLDGKLSVDGGLGCYVCRGRSRAEVFALLARVRESLRLEVAPAG